MAALRLNCSWRPEGFVVPTSWNALTGDLAYYDHRTFEIWIRTADGKTRRLLGGPGRKRSGRFSPDGKWIAFVSDETGDYQVYVTAYPGPGATVTVSTKGGLSPIWSADGRELFFRLGTKMLAARMSVARRRASACRWSSSTVPTRSISWGISARTSRPMGGGS